MVRRGERHLGSTATVEWLASFAPRGQAEVLAFVFDTASIADRDERLHDETAVDLAPEALAEHVPLHFARRR